MKNRVLFLLLLVFSHNTYSATSTTTFLVSAVVVSGCVIAATPLVFGTIDPSAAGNTDMTTTVTPTCTLGTTYNVGLNAGTTSGSTVTTRKMAGTVVPANTINYALYRDAAHTQNWGNTVGTDTVAGTGIGLPQLLTVYGRVPGSQPPVPADTYTDTITATITF